MVEWMESIKRAFSAIYVIDTDEDEQDIPPFRERWGGLDVEAFVRALREGDPKDQQIAAFAIGSLPSCWAKEILLPYLHHEAPAVRWTVALKLGQMHAEEAFPALLHMAQEFLPPHDVFVKYDWYDVCHMGVARMLGTWGKTEAIPVLRKVLAHLWQAEQDASIDVDTQIWWHYQDALVEALGKLGDLESLSLITSLSTPRKLLWSVILAMSYLGYLPPGTLIHETVMELLASSPQADQTGRLALLPNLLCSRMGFAPEEVATLATSYQQIYMDRWDQEAIRQDLMLKKPVEDYR